MSNYSYNLDREGIVFAKLYDVNASYKNLNAVCDAIRYLRAEDAIAVLDRVIAMEMPILYKRFSKHMGARHELGGRKGRYPQKAAREVKKVLVNAIANAANKGLDSGYMYVVHASSNKTHIERRYPSKGSLTWGRGTYGRRSLNHSDIEYAKIEIGLSESSKKLSGNMLYFIKKNGKAVGKKGAGQKSPEKKDGGRAAAAVPKKAANALPHAAEAKAIPPGAEEKALNKAAGR